jgi:hypothetical protein
MIYNWFIIFWNENIDAILVGHAPNGGRYRRKSVKNIDLNLVKKINYKRFNLNNSNNKFKIFSIYLCIIYSFII